MEILDRKSTSLLRGVCMIMILLHHCYQNWGFGGGNSFVDGVLHDSGYLSTGVFFFLSGYGLYLSMKKNNFILPPSYVKIRIVKLLVPYVIASIFVGILETYLGIFKFSNIFYFFLLSTSNGEPYWFLIVILGLYVITFVLFTNKKISDPILYLTIAVLLYAVIMRASMLGLHWYNSVICFPVGMYVGKYITKIKSLSMIPLLGIFLLYFLTLYPKGQCAVVLLFSFISVIVMKFLPFQDSKLISWVKYVGDNSLLFFFAHGLAIRLVIDLFNTNNIATNYIAAFVLSLGITVFYSLIQKLIMNNLMPAI